MKADPTSVLEAGYNIELPDDEWVEQICRRTAEAFGVTTAFAYLYDASGFSLELSATAVFTDSSAFRGFVEHQIGPVATAIPGSLLPALYEPAPRVGLASEIQKLDEAARRAVWEGTRDAFDVDMADMVAVRAGGMDLRGLLFAFPLLGDQRLKPRTKALLERVGAHLAAAYRLRARSQEAESACAILSGDGKLLHAQDGQVEQRHPTLAEAIGRMEFARRRAVRGNAEESVAAWQALVDGRWSVIDHVDTDGKRLVLARRNEPLGRDLMAIHDADRQVLALASLGYPNKQIAYELGLSAAAVTVRLKRGLKTIGLKSRQELISLRAAEASGAAPQG